MTPESRILRAKVNTYIGSFFIFSFGLFILVIGFQIKHMVNPIAEAFAVPQEEEWK